MGAGSLRLRLATATAIALAMALTWSGIVLARLFATHVESRIDVELANHLGQIVAGLELGADGTLQLAAPPADPRFVSPGSGLYWQVSETGGRLTRSRSLWDHELALPADELSPGVLHRHDLPGPTGGTVHAVERLLTTGPDSGPVSFRVAVAVDRREIEEAVQRFTSVLISSLAVLGVALLVSLLAMIQIGLSPLVALRRALARVRDGRAANVEGAFPAEVQPLVFGINALLDKEQATLARARERAGDLAHGFKTPLAVLAAIARELRRDGATRAAGEIETQVDLMSRHVRRELARARMAGAAAVGRGGVALRPLIDKVIAALQRITADGRLDWRVAGAAEIRVAGDQDDLLELVGNLCDNAAKFAACRIDVTIEARGPAVVLVIADDGEGVPAGSEAAILERGRRLDDKGDGSGLGLAIVARIVETYSGSIRLYAGPLGGLAVEIVLPAAPPEAGRDE